MTKNDFVENEEVILTKNKRRALRRHNDVRKALRKRNISKNNYGFDWYNNLHEYSKNKIHCSCALCAFRSKLNPRLSVADEKKIAAMDAEIKNFETE